MRARCLNPKHPAFPNYGGRGIGICERWTSFEAFHSDMGNRPSPLHSLDRQDNSRGYEPGNCRWATAAEQVANRRSVRTVTVDGRAMSLPDACAAIGISPNTVHQRLHKGWSVERALNTPLDVGRSRRQKMTADRC